MLPEKWCIKLTKENQAVVGAYYDKQCNLKDQCYIKNWTNYYLKSNDISKRDVIKGNCDPNFADSGKPSGYTEITFDQFKEYVLKEPVNSLYEIY